jgi:hypothetical protein
MYECIPPNGFRNPFKNRKKGDVAGRSVGRYLHAVEDLDESFRELLS